MRLNRKLLRQQLIAWTMITFCMTSANGQERPTILAGHGTLSGSILPLWVGTDAKLFEKHGVQVRPIYLPRAAGRPALVSGDIQVYFSAGPPVVQMRLSGGDVAVTSCVVHKLTSKVMVSPAIQKIADLRGKVVAVANPGSASDFAAKTIHGTTGHEAGPGYFNYLQRLDERSVCRPGQRQSACHLCVTA
jgi:NitT/TauT family transport system substrate-binding protein